MEQRNAASSIGLGASPRRRQTQVRAGGAATWSSRSLAQVRRGNRLVVEGLDARDGSPVLDIKSG